MLLGSNVMQAVIDDYQTTNNTVPQIAAKYQLKPAEVSAILRMNGIAIKRGPRDMTNHPLLSPDVRAKRLETVRKRSLERKVAALLEEYDYESVMLALELAHNLKDAGTND